MGKNILITSLIISLLTFDFALGQDLSQGDYKKALWMTTRFYGGQRSGENNWLLYNHLPSGVNANLRGLAFRADNDNGYDISGGWHDCGDHVKFGQTQYYSGYMLAKAYEEFKEGYDDYYSFDYFGYNNSGNYTWEGGAGQPNGIPDILDELKHATDFFIKCSPNGSTFYFQVGNGGGSADHATNNTAVKVQTLATNQGGNNDNGAANPSGPFRPVCKNPDDGSMASFSAATLALMSRVYEPFDPAYAALCLTHAEYAYEYASNHVGQSQNSCFGGFYGANDNPMNAWAICLAEMHWATGQNSYRSTALSLSAGNGTEQVRPNGFYTYDYSNNGELALYVLSQLGHSSAGSAFDTRIQNHWLSNGNYGGEGTYTAGGNWGQLRYVANAGFLIALYNEKNGTNLDAKVYSNIDYILGSNNAKQSFVVGFEPSSVSGVVSASKPHHRSVFLRDDTPSGASFNSVSIPTKNRQFGALVGGHKSNSASYNDDWTEYVNTEVCIDYNAGLVGALGAIAAQVDPVDTNKFLTQCASPGDLGGNQTLCGAGTIDLDAGLGTKANRTFQWFKDDVPQGGASASATTRSVTQAGVWKVVVDSAGECSRSASVTITGVLPDVDLGADVELCSPAQVSLDAQVSGGGVTYAWTKDNQSFASTKTVTAVEAGTYEVIVSASGCPSKSDQIIVTSLLPNVQNDVLCAAGTANLSALGSGTYEWWADQSGGVSPLTTGNSYSPSISQDETYWVNDVSSFSGSVGPASEVISGGTNWGFNTGNRLIFTPASDFSITSIKVKFGSIYNNVNDAVLKLKVYDSGGSEIATFTSEPSQASQTNNTVLVEFEFSDFNVQQSWGADLQLGLDNTSDNIGNPIWEGSGASFPYNSNPAGVMSITGSTGGGGTDAYHYFYDWQISAGVTCDRRPVFATIDAANPSCSGGCSAPSLANITPSTTQSICMGEDVTLTANLVSGYLYRWYKDGSVYTTATVNDNSLVVSEAGSYKVRIADGDISDNACYLESSEVVVNVNALPIAAISTTALNYCEGDNGITLDATNAGGGATYSWSGPVTGSSQSLSNATAGSYTVMVTQNGCAATSSAKVVVEDAAPTASIATTALTYCVGDNGVTLDATNAGGGATYLWAGPITGSSQSLDNATAGSYTVTVTRNGCSATSASKTVSTTTPPTANITTADLNYCEGDNGVTLTAENVGGATYSWAGPVTGSGQTLTSATAGSYMVTVSEGSCSATSSAKVVVEDVSPLANITTTTLNYCEGVNGVTLTAESAGVGATYFWSGPVTSSSQTLANATAGVYTVSVTLNGCVSTSASVTVVEDALPIASISTTDLTYCVGDNGVTLDATNAGVGATYSWTGPVTGSSQMLTNATAGSYAVIVTRNGCSATSASKTVATTTPPTANITTTDLSYCTGSGGVNLSAENAGSGTVYTWNGPVTGSGLNLLNAIGGVYSVDVAKDGCVATSGVVTVVENTSPIANITTTNLDYCQGDNGLLLSAEDAGSGASYTWNGPVTGSGITLGNATAGTYSVEVTKDGCVSTSSAKVINENNSPIAQIATAGAGLVYCSAQVAGVTLSATDAGPGVIYNWNGPVTGSGMTLNEATAGVYSLDVTENGCLASSSTVTVLEDCSNSCTPPSTVSIDQGASIIGCEGDDVSVSGTVALGAPVDMYYYTWVFDNGAETNLTTPSTTYSDLDLTSLTLAESGTIKLRVEDSDGLLFNDPLCYIDALTNLDVLESTTINSEPLGATECEGADVNLSVVASGDGLVYDWKQNTVSLGVSSPTLSLSNISNTDGGVYTVDVIGSCGSVTSQLASVAVETAPVITSEPNDISNCEGDAGMLSVNAVGTGVLSYAWTKVPSIIVGSDDPDLEFPSLTSGDAGDYFVDITNICGTTTSALAMVDVSSGVVPSVSLVSDIIEICDGGDVTLTATGTGGGLSPTYTFLANGSPIVGAIDISTDTYNVSNVNSTTNYTVEMTSNSSCLSLGATNPIGSSIVSVEVSQSPIANITTTDLSYCAGENGVDLNAEDAGVGAVYTWNGPVVGNGILLTNAIAGTYTVDVDVNGCLSSSLSVEVIEKALPLAQVATSGADLVYCSTDNNGVSLSAIDAGVGAVYTWTGATLANGITISNVTTGSYVVGVGLNGCNATSMPVDVMENCTATCIPPSDATITSTIQNICDGETVDLIANTEAGYFYEWYENGSLLDSGVDMDIITVNSDNAYTVRIAETANDINDGACYLESTPYTIAVNPIPVASIVTSGADLVYCSTDNNGVTLSAVDAGAGAVYSWSGPVTGNGMSLSNATAGVYSIDVELNGCSATSSIVNVSENCTSTCTPPSQSIISIPSSPANICDGDIQDLVANSESGYYYEWYEGGSLVNSGVDLNIITISAAGDYTVKIAETVNDINDGACYLESTPVAITVSDLPVASIITSGADLTYCSSSTNGVVLNAVDAGIGATYNWSGPVNGSGESLVDATSGSYSVSVVSQEGCFSTSSSVTVIEDCGAVCTPPSAATISNLSPTSICSGSTETLIANSEPGYYYEWYEGNTVVSSGIDLSSYAVSTAGSYSVRIAETANDINDMACYLEAVSVVIDVTDGPLVSPTLLSGNVSVCIGSDEVYSFTPASNGENLVIACESGCAGVVVNQSGNTATVTAGSSDFVLGAYFENTCGVSPQELVNVTVEQSTVPVIFITSDHQSVCIGGRVNFSAIVSSAGTTPSVLWYKNNISTGNTGLTYRVDPVSDGDEIYAEVTASSNCGVGGISSSNVVSLTTFDIPEDRVISGPDTICINDEPVHNYSVVGNPGSVYSWTLPDSAVILNGEGTNAIELDFRGELGAFISLTEILAGGCFVDPISIDVKNDCIDGFSDDLFAQNIELYPNPSTSSFKLSVNDFSETLVRIVDMKGVLMEEFEIEGREFIEFGDTLNQGMYLVQLISEGKSHVITINKID